MSDEDFLARWSRRKHAARSGATPEAEAAPSALPGSARAPSPATPPSGAAGEPAPLPPVESLTPESDFTPFMGEKVDPVLRRQALRTLFRDPRFNVMDGLDVYIDDYSKPDPIPAEWLGKLRQMARLGEYRPADETGERPEGAPQGGAPAEMPAPEQGLAAGPDLPGSDTSAAGSPPPKLGES